MNTATSFRFRLHNDGVVDGWWWMASIRGTARTIGQDDIPSAFLYWLCVGCGGKRFWCFFRSLILCARVVPISSVERTRTFWISTQKCHNVNGVNAQNWLMSWRFSFSTFSFWTLLRAVCHNIVVALYLTDVISQASQKVIHQSDFDLVFRSSSAKYSAIVLEYLRLLLLQ